MATLPTLGLLQRYIAQVLPRQGPDLIPARAGSWTHWPSKGITMREVSTVPALFAMAHA
jgi:hypothetical protein